MTDFGVKKAAKTLVRAVKGEVTFEALERYIEGFGYSVIIFTDTHKLLNRYVLEETAKTKSAFTYVDKHTKLIFIRETLHASDKLLLLLHEIGHVVLGHMEGEHLRVTDKYETEYEADHFAHLVLDLAARKKYRWRLFG